MTVAEYAAVDGLVLETAHKIEKIGGVKTVEYGKRVGEKLGGKIKRTSLIFMLFISALTGLSAAIIIFNTIKLSLFKFKRKIMIYKLVGATKMFVTAPYVFSSFIEASLAYLVAVIANMLFIKGGVETYLLKDSYFLLYTPPEIIYVFFYLLLISTSTLSAFICVLSFLRRLRSLNEA